MASPLFSRRPAAAVAVALAVLLGAAHAHGQSRILSDGPLREIWITPAHGCQVTVHDAYAYYPRSSVYGACGTFLATGGSVYGERTNYPLAGSRPRASEPVSQSPVSGNGSASTPYRQTTVTRLPDEAGPAAGAQLSETVSYVTGQDFYRADATVINSTGKPLSLRLYHVADCFLSSGGIFGTGFVNVRGDSGDRVSVACLRSGSNGVTESLVPTVGPNGFMGDFYSYVWQTVGVAQPLTNRPRLAEDMDHSLALSFDDTLAPGQRATYGYLAGFTPHGTVPDAPPFEPAEPLAPAYPEPPEPSEPRPVPTETGTVRFADTVYAPDGAAAVGVRATCVTESGICLVEVGTSSVRRTLVLGRRQAMRVRERLTSLQRRELRRDCATELALRAVVYQPAGHRPRTVRRIVQVLCNRLRGRSCDARTAAAFRAELSALRRAPARATTARLRC